MSKRDTTSRRRTPWDGLNNISESQALITTTIHESYDQKHPSLIASGEADFINSQIPDGCPICGSVHYVKNGKTRNGIIRYLCKDCASSFTPTTGTIFDQHKISVKEWVEYCLNLFRHVSITAGSWNNRNAYTTSRYWLQKLFLILDGIQDNIVLSGDVWLDETYISEKKGDIDVKDDGTKYRGHSHNQYCIGVATDGKTTVLLLEGMAHPTSQMTYDTFCKHIEPGSKLLHDREKSHAKLVKDLSLTEEVYSAAEIKKLPSKENPMQPVNNAHSLLKGFLHAHSGFNREELQGFLNLFAFLSNPPYSYEEKVDIILNLAFKNHKTLRYRDFF